MSTSRYRAWKFVHPDLSAREGSMGLSTSGRPGGDTATRDAGDTQSFEQQRRGAGFCHHS